MRLRGCVKRVCGFLRVDSTSQQGYNCSMTTEEFLAKGEESLAGAESEFANGRYNDCASRCYYACFEGAIRVLLRAGIQPSGPGAERGHAFVQAQFVGHFIHRRKQYPAHRAADRGGAPGVCNPHSATPSRRRPSSLRRQSRKLSNDKDSLSPLTPRSGRGERAFSG